MNAGLVLEGGGMRGIYTAGVLDVLMENNITFQGVIGTSAGVVHGCSFLSGQKGRSIRYYKKYCNEPRFMSFKSYLKTGNVVETDFAYRQLPNKLDPYDYAAFSQNDTPFYATVTNIESGLAEHIQITDMLTQIDVVRASASLPYFSQIVEFGGKKYLDGGCADAIPLKAFQNMGYKKNLVVLTRPADYLKKPELKGFAWLKYRKYPSFVKLLKRRHEIYNQTLEYINQCEKRGEIFVIRPTRPLPASRMEHDPQVIEATYNIGREDALSALEQLKNWMK